MVRSLSYGQQLQTNYQALFAAAPYFETLADEEARYALAALPKGGDSIERIGSIASTTCRTSTPKAVRCWSTCTSVEQGEIVGVIGPSGSGKSTLVQLLLRLREPTKGRVLADGRDVASISLSRLVPPGELRPAGRAAVRGNRRRQHPLLP